MTCVHVCVRGLNSRRLFACYPALLTRRRLFLAAAISLFLKQICKRLNVFRLLVKTHVELAARVR